VYPLRDHPVGGEDATRRAGRPTPSTCSRPARGRRTSQRVASSMPRSTSSIANESVAPRLMVFVVFDELAGEVHRLVEVALLEVARREDVAAVGGVDDPAGAETLDAFAEHRDRIQQLRSHHRAGRGRIYEMGSSARTNRFRWCSRGRGSAPRSASQGCRPRSCRAARPWSRPSPRPRRLPRAA